METIITMIVENNNDIMHKSAGAYWWTFSEPQTRMNSNLAAQNMLSTVLVHTNEIIKLTF